MCRVCAGIKLGCNDPEQCSASDLKKNYKLLVDLSINSISFMIQFDPLCVSNNSFTEKKLSLQFITGCIYLIKNTEKICNFVKYYCNLK